MTNEKYNRHGRSPICKFELISKKCDSGTKLKVNFSVPYSEICIGKLIGKALDYTSPKFNGDRFNRAC